MGYRISHCCWSANVRIASEDALSVEPITRTDLDPIRPVSEPDPRPNANIATVIGRRNTPEAVLLAPKP